MYVFVNCHICMSMQYIESSIIKYHVHVQTLLSKNFGQKYRLYMYIAQAC